MQEFSNRRDEKGHVLMILGSHMCKDHWMRLFFFHALRFLASIALLIRMGKYMDRAVRESGIAFGFISSLLTIDFV